MGSEETVTPPRRRPQQPQGIEAMRAQLQVLLLRMGCVYISSLRLHYASQLPTFKFHVAMESSDTLSPFSSPLSSPPKTPHSSPQKASKSSPTSSTHRYSPERQCTCPCGPFKAELKTAVTFMTFRRYPMPALISCP